MSMTVVVTRDVPDRFRGFLASVMLEIAPGVYTSPDCPVTVREQVWEVMDDWYSHLNQGSILMTWRDAKQPGGQGLRALGLPTYELVEHEGMWLSRMASR